MKRCEQQALSAAVLAYCSTPKTLAEIKAHFGDLSVSAEYAVQTLVKTGRLVNLRRRWGRIAGLYQSSATLPAGYVPPAPEPRAAVQHSSPRYDATELVRAWMGRAA
jgi:hypothetical protein